ncbi:glycoside hydrolase family 2 protein [Streptomyces aureus]
MYDAFAGVGWYRRYFHLDPQDEGRRLTVVFDGVQTDCVVYLNGEKVAEHQGGYMGFVVDITGKARFDGDNVLAVRVSNVDDLLTPPGKPRTQLGFLTFGGIYRGVTLRMTEPVHISDPLQEDLVAGGGVFVSYPKATTLRATAQVKTHVVNKTADAARIRLTTVLYDAQGTTVAHATDTGTVSEKDGRAFTQTLSVARPHLWHPDSPYLYRLVSQVFVDDHLVDTVTTRTGIRRIDYKADGFYLNGERLYLRGANCHQNYAYIGDAAPASMKYREALRLKLGGFNAVRAAHYPHDVSFLDACDELGLLVVACEPGWQYWNGDQTFVSRTYRDITTMIRRDRNRPSMIPVGDLAQRDPLPPVVGQGGRLCRACRDAGRPDVHLGGLRHLGRRVRRRLQGCQHRRLGSRTERALRHPRMGRLGRSQPHRPGGRRERDGGPGRHPPALLERRRLLGLGRPRRQPTHRRLLPVGLRGLRHQRRLPEVRRRRHRPLPQVLLPLAQVHAVGTQFEPRRPDGLRRQRPHRRLREEGAGLQQHRPRPAVPERPARRRADRADNAATAPNVAAKGGSPYYTFTLPQFAAGELSAEGYLGDKLAATHRVNTPGEAHHWRSSPTTRAVGPHSPTCWPSPWATVRRTGRRPPASCWTRSSPGRRRHSSTWPVRSAAAPCQRRRPRACAWSPGCWTASGP